MAVQSTTATPPVTQESSQAMQLLGFHHLTAITANAASFLLPTSNLTNLLVLSRSPLPMWTYLGESWVAWLAVSDGLPSRACAE